MSRPSAYELVFAAAKQYKACSVLGIMEDTDLAHRSVTLALDKLVAEHRMARSKEGGAFVYRWKSPTFEPVAEQHAKPGPKPVSPRITADERTKLFIEKMGDKDGFGIQDAVNAMDWSYDRNRDVLNKLVLRGMLRIERRGTGANFYYWTEKARAQSA